MKLKTVLIAGGVLVALALAWRYVQQRKVAETPRSDEANQADAQASNTGQDLDPEGTT